MNTNRPQKRPVFLILIRQSVDFSIYPDIINYYCERIRIWLIRLK